MREEDRELKEWLRGLLPEGYSREDIADELNVTRKTITSMLSLSSTSFANGRTMLGYLRFVGALRDAPEEHRQTSRLARLEARQLELAEMIAQGFDSLAQAIARLEARPPGEDARKHPGQP